jgi:hypothetical protein
MPTCDTGSHLIAACHYCFDDSNSLCPKFGVNAMYAIKMMNNMKVQFFNLVGCVTKAEQEVLRW